MKRVVLTTLVALAALSPCATAGAQSVYSGKLEVRHSDDFRHARGNTTWNLVRGKRRIPILPTAPTHAASGSKVTVRGHRVGHWLEGKVRARRAARVHAATALGSHSVAVVLVNFASDANPEPWTPAYVNQRIFTDPDSTAAFYNEESYGNITLIGHVFGWYTIAGSQGCDVDTWATQARNAVTAGGGSLAGYDHVMYVFPRQASCGWAGLGELPGSQTWLNGDISVRVAAHELGHNMGLHHASSYSCSQNGAAVTISSSCTASEYGDPFDVMGLNPRHSNAWHLEQLGVVRGANVQTVASSGTYTLRSALTPGTGTDLLRVSAGGSRYYDLEIRQGGGLFENYLSTDPVVNGVSIHYDPDPSVITQSLLLDATPGSGFSNSSLAPGATFSDGSVSITTDSVSPGAATVSVITTPAADVTPPTAPASFSAVPVQGGANLAWAPSTDNVGVAGYRVYRDDVLAGSTPGTTWSDRNLAPGSTHSYRVSAYDAAGNAATSVRRFVTVPAAPAPPPPPPGSGSGHGGPPPPDVVSPTVFVFSPHDSARLRGHTAIAASATDDRGVTRIELFIDGRRVVSAAADRLTHSWNLRRVRAGTHLLLVRAFDAAGNATARTVRVHVVAAARAARRS